MTDERGLAGGVMPERLGHYLLERRLGSGGMGVVYLARTVAGRQVAVKVIRREYAEDPGFRARFRREVAAARRVSGAFTAPVVDADPEGDPPWLATLYVPGGSLTDRVERDGPLDAREAARVGAQLAEALADIHRCGLVHRDLKPGNVLLAGDGVRVIDFGISRALSSSRRLTESGAVLGSPPFMAPEQLTGGSEVSEAADVFALGAVVAFAATGHSPFEAGGLPGGDPLAVAYRVVHEQPDLADVPDSLRDLVSLCLAKEPGQRPEVASVLRMAAWADTREQATVVRGSPAWQGAVRSTGGTGPAAGRVQGRGRDQGRGRGRRRRRLTAVAACLAVAAAAGLGVWLTTSSDGADTGDAPDGGAGPAREPVAFRPWEVALQDLGVLDTATTGFHCQPTLEEDLLCVAGGELTVLLDAATGEELWRHNGPRTAVGEPSALQDSDGRMFAVSSKGVVVLNTEGQALWEIDAPELAGSLLTVGGSVMLQNGDSTLRFYERQSPRLIGTWEAPGRYITGTLSNDYQVLAESRVDDTGTDPQLMLLDGDGRELWAQPVLPPPEALGLLEPVGIDRDAAYFQELDPEIPVITAVLRLDLLSGEWTRTKLPHPAEPRTVVADGLAYASDTAGRITAVDAAAGEVLWSETTGAVTTSEPAVVGEVVYLTDGDGRLYRVDARNGTVLGRGEAHRGTPGLGSDGWAPAPVIADGTAFVTTLGNTLYATQLTGG